MKASMVIGEIVVVYIKVLILRCYSLKIYFRKTKRLQENKLLKLNKRNLKPFADG